MQHHSFFRNLPPSPQKKKFYDIQLKQSNLNHSKRVAIDGVVQN